MTRQLISKAEYPGILLILQGGAYELHPAFLPLLAFFLLAEPPLCIFRWCRVLGARGYGRIDRHVLQRSAKATASIPHLLLQEQEIPRVAHQESKFWLRLAAVSDESRYILRIRHQKLCGSISWVLLDKDIPPPEMVRWNRPNWRPSLTSSRLLSCTRSNWDIAYRMREEQRTIRTLSHRPRAVVSARTARFWYVLGKVSASMYL